MLGQQAQSKFCTLKVLRWALQSDSLLRQFLPPNTHCCCSTAQNPECAFIPAWSIHHRCISDTPTCTNFQPFKSPTPWTLPSGNGTKTVYVWIRDAANKTSGTPGSATVGLDAKSGLLGLADPTSTATKQSKVVFVVTAVAKQM
jgi:hypothetical protein